jgi:hypothetical protein
MFAYFSSYMYSNNATLHNGKVLKLMLYFFSKVILCYHHGPTLLLPLYPTNKEHHGVMPVCLSQTFIKELLRYL